MKNLNTELELSITQISHNGDNWQTEVDEIPTATEIERRLKLDLSDKEVFKAKGVDRVEISIKFPKEEFNKNDVENTFSSENNGCIQDEDNDFFYCEYYKSRD